MSWTIQKILIKEHLQVVAPVAAAEVTTPRLVIDSAKPPYTMLFKISNWRASLALGPNFISESTKLPTFGALGEDTTSSGGISMINPAPNKYGSKLVHWDLTYSDYTQTHWNYNNTTLK